MVAETESIEIGSDDEFESDTDEEKMRNIFNTSSQEIENTASELQVKDCMYNLKYLKNNTYCVL